MKLPIAIDPCIISQPLLRVSNFTKDKLSPYGEISEEQKERNRQINRQNGYLDFEPTRPKYDDHYIVDYLGEAGMSLDRQYETYETSIAGIPIDLKDNPALDTINCLASGDSVGARTSAKEQTRSSINERVRLLEQAGASATDPDYQKLIAVRDNFEQIYDKVGACSFLPGNSQLQEAWSDWVSSEVLGEEVRQLKDDEKLRFSLESFSFFLSLECRANQPEQLERVNDFMQDMGCIPQES